MPYYSFILPCYNQWKLTEQAINTLNDSISPAHKKKGIELIVINNGSKDETKIRVEQIKEHLRQEIEIVPIHFTENVGYLMAINIGFSKCRGEIITLLNNDLIFPENWLDGIVRTLEENPSIGAASPFLSYANGPANVGVRFDSLQEIKDFAGRFMEDNKNKIVFTQYIIGACLSIKRELFSLIGGNDFWFGLGWFDDQDWSLRTCIAGYKIAVVGASFVYHIGNATISQSEHNDLVTAALKANSEKFTRKWAATSGYDPQKIIESTVFSKEKHTFPCTAASFSQPSPFINQSNDTSKNKVILLADWTNDCSQWRNKLLYAKSNMTLNENQVLTIWVPKTYYPEQRIKNEVNSILGDNQNYINYYFEEVPPINLLQFLTQYDAFWTVQNDYVNLYFKYIIENSALNIDVQ